MAEIIQIGGLPGHERKGGGFQTGYAVFSSQGICPTLLANGGGYGILVLEEIMKVKVIGQMDNTLDNTFESANRVYDKNGLCPTIPTCAGGGVYNRKSLINISLP